MRLNLYKYYYCILLLFSICFVANAQQNDSLIIKTSEGDIFNPIKSKLQFFLDTKAKELNPSEIVFTEFAEIKKRIAKRSDLAKYNLYLHFKIFNDKVTPDTSILYFGNIVKKINLYIYDSSLKKYKQISIGRTTDGSILINTQPYKLNDYIVLIKFSRTSLGNFAPYFFQISQKPTFFRSLYNERVDSKMFDLILSGILLIMIFFTATNYYLSKKKEFLYYSLYSLCICLLVFCHSLIYKRSGWLVGFYVEYIDFILLLLGSIFYVFFTRHFLNTPKSYKKLNMLLIWQQRFIIAMIIIFSLVHFCFNNLWLETMIEVNMKVILLIFGIIYIIMALKEKNQLLNYLAWGNALAIFFWIISLMMIIFITTSYSIITSAMAYYQIGLVMALLSFLLGLTYKNRKELIEQTQQQEAFKLEAEKQKFEKEIAVVKAQQEERNRISADMHDDLGAGMTSIRLYSELAKTKLADQNIPELNKISSSADELLGKMNAIIWSMASSNDSLQNTVAYLRSYSIELFENTPIALTVDLPEDIPNIVVPGIMRRNIFLVIKEALNNILKHSEATKVVIALNIEGQSIILTVHDNGKGIDFNNLRQFSNGLKNMRQRMNDVDIKFTIENNNGTLITLKREILQEAIS